MTFGMPTDAIPPNDLEAAIASLRAGSSFATAAEALQLPNWRDEDWKQLFGFTSIRRVIAGDAEMKSVMEKSGVLGSPSIRFAAAA